MEGPQTRGILVTGEGSVDARPDTAYISLGVVSRQASLQAAMREAAEGMTAVLTRMADAGVAEGDIQTSNYNVWQEDTRQGVSHAQTPRAHP